MLSNYPFKVLLVLLISFFTINLLAQPTCDEPLVLIFDPIDSYEDGDATPQAAHWDVWPGFEAGGIVTTEEASSGEKSIKIDGSIASQDVLLRLGDSTSGHYLLRWEMYVPDSTNAYFNIQHLPPTETEGFWGADFYFDAGGTGEVDLFDDNLIGFSYPTNEWFPVILLLDISNDEARLIVDEVTAAAWTFSNGVTNGQMPNPSNQLNSINFFPIDATYSFYVDNVAFQQIGEAEMGQYCYMAGAIEPGVHTVPDLTCFGGGYDLGGGDGAEKGYWFTYTPAEDGIISIASCNGGADTRGWIFVGECHDLDIVGVNDDQCDQGDGNDYASYREAYVTAGNTYYILWDNAWSSSGFDFELSFTTEPGTPGNFCQTAISIQPGEQVLEEMDGDAAVAGKDINTFTTSTTPYAQSEWYSFTPTANGVVTITSCEGAGSDTHVYVYTGDCATFNGLTLVDQNDNSDICPDLQSFLQIEVTAGTTYYIEWIDRWEEAPFFWNLFFEAMDAVEVTFQVDMSLEEVDPAGVFLAGSFSNFSNMPMADDDEDGVYELTIPLPVDSDQEYKFKNGPDGWENVDTSLGEICAGGDFGNRLLTVGSEDMTLDAVCFGYCVACAVVDVEAIALERGVHLFPNPNKGHFTLQFDLPEPTTNLQVDLNNYLGQTVWANNYGKIQRENIVLHMPDLPTGTYFLRLTDGTQQITRKVIIE